MEEQIVTCSNCGRGAAPGQSLCMNCGSDLPAAPVSSLLRPLDYRCPHCGTPHPPQIVKRLSGAGVLLLLVGLASGFSGLIFFLVCAVFALFLMQEQQVCPICKHNVS